MTHPDGQGQGGQPASPESGEVLISGLDTGPRAEERENLSPTDSLARFQPSAHPAEEPTDEDG